MVLEDVRKELLKKTRSAVKKRFGQSDVHIVRAVNVLDELDSLFNQLSEQLTEWYSVHFPELSRIVNDNEKFLEMVCRIGERKNFSKNKVQAILKNQQKAVLIEKKGRDSLGSEVEHAVLKQIQKMSESALSLRKQRKRLEGFIEKETQRLMPGFSKACGGTLAARMLSEAGSFRKLAIMPSSTMQVLGAEKALFRHMRFGAKPPKHGFLFQHPEVQNASRREKGKIARKLAGKLSIAARKDFFARKRE